MTMFSGVHEKLECAEYFLNNLKTLAKNAGGFPYIKEKVQMRASLDGFFFEIISAKDFFLQGINNHYALGLKKQEATNIVKLKQCLECKGKSIVLDTILQIEIHLSDSDSWLWQLNNYRNSATHRELLHFGNVVTIPTLRIALNDEIREKIKLGKYRIRPIFEGEEKAISPDVPKVDVPRENMKTFLFKDPEDPSQGNADMEVIPYCEQSLNQMTDFLDDLYSKL